MGNFGNVLAPHITLLRIQKCIRELRGCKLLDVSTQSKNTKQLGTNGWSLDIADDVQGSVRDSIVVIVSVRVSTQERSCRTSVT